MNCRQFEMQLEQMDGCSLALNAEANQHISGCNACAEMKNDLAYILEMAHDMPSEYEPPARMWENIEYTLRTEGIIKPAQATADVRPSLGRLFTFPKWAVATAATVAILAGGAVYNFNHSNIDQLGQKNGSTLMKNGMGEEFDKTFLAEIEKTAPSMKPVYEKNLKSVNKFISDAKEAVDADPNDSEAVALLHDAQSQKAMLVDVATSQSMR